MSQIPLFFVFKVLVVWVLVLLARNVFDRLFHQVQLRGPLMLFFVSSEERALMLAWCRHSWRESSRREWLLSLALGFWSGKLYLALVGVGVFSLFITGWFLDLNAAVASVDPPQLYFTLASSSWATLFQLAMFATGLTVATTKPFLVTILGLLLLMGGILSLPGFLVIITAERLGLSILSWLLLRDRSPFFDLAPRVLSQCLVLILIVISGAALTLPLSEHLGLGTMRVYDRLILITLAFAVILVLEALVCFVSYHFYNMRPKETIETLPPPFVYRRGWLTPALRSMVLLKATQRQDALQLLGKDLDDHTKSKIPPAVLQRLQREQGEVQKILQSSWSLW